MLSSTTPFKIHDENAGVPLSRKKGINSAVKGLSIQGGLVGTKTPKVPKSSRKALGSISVNIKGQGIDGVNNISIEKAPSVLQFPAPATGSKTATKAKGPATKVDASSMICSHVEKEEDAYDYTMRSASNIKTVIMPGTTDVQGGAMVQDDVDIWQESAQDVATCAALTVEDDADQDYTFSLPDEEDW